MKNTPLKTCPAYKALSGESTFAANMEADIGDRYVPLEVWASPIRDDAGNIEFAIVVIEDITQRRQVEVELAEYRKHLETLVEKRTTELEEVNQNLQLRIEWLSEVNKIHQTITGEDSLATAYEQMSATIHQMLGAELVFITALGFQSSPKSLHYSCKERSFLMQKSLRLYFKKTPRCARISNWAKSSHILQIKLLHYQPHWGSISRNMTSNQ